MEKKHQIFLSSTYEDLKTERDEVSKAILEIGDIPVGMEMFSAADETQWKLIQRQIEQSDYYIVIVAHRYGSVVDNTSYTEREYDYAVEIGVPVMGFVIDSAADWPPKFVDRDAETLTQLEAFKEKVKSRMVSFWNNADALSGRVLAALGKQKILSPRPGWVRANNLPSQETMSEMAELGKEVARLSEENADLREKASIESTFRLVDAMADDVECQALIFMYESESDLPRYTPYVFRHESGGGGSGQLGGFGDREKLINAGFTRFAGGGHYLGLTDMGRDFAQWLIERDRKCDFFWTPAGGWGEVKPGSAEEKWMNDAIQRVSGEEPKIVETPTEEASADANRDDTVEPNEVEQGVDPNA